MLLVRPLLIANYQTAIKSVKENLHFMFWPLAEILLFPELYRLHPVVYKILDY
jgi:hypothetical protein